MLKSGRRIHLELIKLVIGAFIILLVITGLLFYSFLSTILPPSLMGDPATRVRFAVFGLIAGILLLGITYLLVKWFTYHLLGPIPRLQRQIGEMADTGNLRNLTTRKKDKLEDFIKTINLLIEKMHGIAGKDNEIKK